MKRKGIFIFKKIICCFAVLFSIVLVFGVYISKEKPIFSAFANRFEVSLISSSSNAKFVVANEFTYKFLFNKTGEAFTTTKYDKQEILSYFNAEVVFTESVENIENIYAFSNSIRYEKIINGKRINIQIAVSEGQIKVGSPIIFASF